MPFTLPEFRDRFTWSTDPDGHPLADCIPLGSGLYVTVCPACGAFHPLPGGVRDGDVTPPTCPPRPSVSPELQRWHQHHPQAATCAAVRIRVTTFAALRATIPPALPELVDATAENGGGIAYANASLRNE